MMTTPTKLSQIRDDLLARIGNSLADKLDALRRFNGMHHVAVVESPSEGCLELCYLRADELSMSPNPAYARPAAALAARSVGGGGPAVYHLVVAIRPDGPAWFEFGRHDGPDLEPGFVEEAEQACWDARDREFDQYTATLRRMPALRLSLAQTEFDRVVDAANRAGVEGRDWVGRALEAYMSRSAPETPPADVEAQMEALRGDAQAIAEYINIYLEEEGAYPDGFGERLEALSVRTGAPRVWLVRRAVLAALGDA
jgi:hypothetical protein